MALWYRAVTLVLLRMGQALNLSMEACSLMRILREDTHRLDAYPWPIRGQELMEVSSSLHSKNAHT
jgi:hypothetical protein